MKQARAPRTPAVGGPDFVALEKLRRRASERALALWDRMPRRPADWQDPYLDVARVERVLPLATRGDRSARLVLRGAVIAYATARRALPPSLLSYLGEAMRTGRPGEAFGLARRKGRVAHVENLKKRATAQIVAFLVSELGDELKALDQAAALLRYRGPRRASTLKRFCGEDLAQLLLHRESDPHRDWRTAWEARRACELLVSLRS